MDLEGSDGRERGEDDTNFERQSALFALAVADVLLVNIWCHDIGREQGSGKPLLKTIFQVRGSLSWPRAGCVQTGPSRPSAGMYVYVGVPIVQHRLYTEGPVLAQRRKANPPPIPVVHHHLDLHPASCRST